MELAARAVDVGHRLEARNHVGDQRADSLVALELAPVDRTVVTQHAAAQRRQHRHFASRPRVARPAAVAQPHVAEHRLLRRRLRLFVARQHRKHERLFRGSPCMAAVERRRQVRNQVQLAERLLANFASGLLPNRLPPRHSAASISPRPQASMHAIVSSPGASGPRIPRRSSSRARIAFLSAGVTPTDPMPCTLLCPRIGSRPALGRPIIPRSSARLAIICTFSTPCRWCVMPIVHPITTLVADMYISATRAIVSRGTPALDLDIAPGCGLDLLPERREPFGVRSTNGRVAAAFEHVFGDAGQQREIAADVRLHIEARDLAAEHQASWIARHTEVHEPDLLRRIDDDDVAAAAAHRHQAAQQPRMVRRRIATDEDEEIAALDVLELHGGGARSEACRQTDAARLVAVVRTVVDVVGAERPRQQLQHESRFVRRAAAGVEEAAPGPVAFSLAATRPSASSHETTR